MEFMEMSRLESLRIRYRTLEEVALLGLGLAPERDTMMYGWYEAACPLEYCMVHGTELGFTYKFPAHGTLE